MDIQTGLNIILGIATLFLGIRTFAVSTKKDTQRESQEMTEIRVQLTQVMSMLRDMQKDIKTSTADFRELTGRVIVIETKLAEVFSRLEKLEEEK
ncbi:MAG: hypothetical protein IJV59_05925 [Eubacterium sp.]|nr:hypothetical protein [Eubacterium sp.]